MNGQLTIGSRLVYVLRASPLLVLHKKRLVWTPDLVVSRARPFFPVLVGVAGSAAGEKGLVSLIVCYNVECNNW